MVDDLFSRFKHIRNDQEIVDIREILLSFVFLVSDEVTRNQRLEFTFRVYDMLDKGEILKSTFMDFYHMV